ncbi:MAG: hypothetical protein LIQ30_10830, partial [Planctomycetes bacterium]|nr:hypothetical protein [Planctomycetota bacterium]
IAAVFNPTVEWFRRDHRDYDYAGQTMGTTALTARDAPAVIRRQVLGRDGGRRRAGTPVPVENAEEEDINHYLWAIDVLTRKLTASGIRVVVTFERVASMPA